MSRLITAAHILVYINGKIYGRCGGIKYRITDQIRKIRGVDSLDPLELAPATSDISGTIRIFRTIADGGIEGAGFHPSHHYLPKGKYFSLELVERLSRTSIFKADYCRVVDQDWDITPKRIVEGVVTFESLSWSNETGALADSAHI